MYMDHAPASYTHETVTADEARVACTARLCNRSCELCITYNPRVLRAAAHTTAPLRVRSLRRLADLEWSEQGLAAVSATSVRSLSACTRLAPAVVASAMSPSMPSASAIEKASERAIETHQS